MLGQKARVVKGDGGGLMRPVRTGAQISVEGRPEAVDVTWSSRGRLPLTVTSFYGDGPAHEST